MTGRDLILYILENGLEDEEVYIPDPIYGNGSLIGFMTVAQAAVKFNVSTPTIFAWISLGKLDAIKIDTVFYIPANSKHPVKYDDEE